MTFAQGKHALAICDRCGRDCKYQELRDEFVRGIARNIQVCAECWDSDHPQNWYGSDVVVDHEGLEEPAPEDFDAVRTLWGWSPVGAGGNAISATSGKVSVRT